MLPSAFVSVAAETANIEAALFILPVDSIVPIDAIDVGASVELLPEIALRHALPVRLVEEFAVVTFVAERTQPMKANFALEFPPFIGGHIAMHWSSQTRPFGSISLMAGSKSNFRLR
jgi:hypothetical protein